MTPVLHINSKGKQILKAAFNGADVTLRWNMQLRVNPLCWRETLERARTVGRKVRT